MFAKIWYFSHDNDNILEQYSNIELLQIDII